MHKAHRERQTGNKAKRKKEKLLGKPQKLSKEESRKQNIKAFGFKSSVKAQKAVRRLAEHFGINMFGSDTRGSHPATWALGKIVPLPPEKNSCPVSSSCRDHVHGS